MTSPTDDVASVGMIVSMVGIVVLTEVTGAEVDGITVLSSTVVLVGGAGVDTDSVGLAPIVKLICTDVLSSLGEGGREGNGVVEISSCTEVDGKGDSSDCDGVGVSGDAKVVVIDSTDDSEGVGSTLSMDDNSVAKIVLNTEISGVDVRVTVVDKISDMVEVVGVSAGDSVGDTLSIEEDTLVLVGSGNSVVTSICSDGDGVSDGREGDGVEEKTGEDEGTTGGHCNAGFVRIGRYPVCFNTGGSPVSPRRSSGSVPFPDKTIGSTSAGDCVPVN